VGNIVSCIYKGNISWESVKYSVWMLLATVPATVLVGRFFCGFFCSFGAVQDLLWLGSHRLRALFPGKRNLKKADRIFRFAKYAVLFYFIIFIWSGVTAVKTAGPWQVFGQYVSFGHWPGLKPFAFSWRSSASFNLYWLTVCTEIFLQIFLPYGSNLFTDFTDIFPEN